ncbi:MAG TPA: hypothetical protein VIG74_00920 [Alphaproteobacteria bacterium]
MSDHPSASDSISLPIEGHMAWPFVIRLIVFASVFVVAVLGSILVLMMPEGQSTMRIEMLAIAFAVVLLFEVVLVRRFIVPLNGDYGRFIIRGGTVDFYPLSTLGMSVSDKPETVPITEFSGVSVHVLEAKGAVTRYSVVLIHPKRGRIIRVRSYLLRNEAEDCARALANLLGLNVI